MTYPHTSYMQIIFRFWLLACRLRSWLRCFPVMQLLVKYLMENVLKINREKTSAMLLGSSAFLSQPDVVAASYILRDSTPVLYSTQLKSLRVIITPSLYREEHVNRLSTRVFSSLHSLWVYKHALSRSLKKRLVKSLIFSHIYYCCALNHHPTVKQNF